MNLFKSNRNIATKTRHSEILGEAMPFAYTEAYKALRTNFEFASLNGEIKTIAITSSVPGEGKSTFSINLAATLAEVGKKVLLVDADLRNPSIHRYLRLRQQDSLGLSNLLSGTATVHDALGHFPNLNIDLILSGTVPPNPVELLSSAKLDELIVKLKNDYDFIIFDTSPVSLVTDAAVLGKACDGVIMIVAQGMVKREVIQKSKTIVENAGGKVIGSVLNNYISAKDSKNDGSFHQYYEYGQSK